MVRRRLKPSASASRKRGGKIDRTRVRISIAAAADLEDIRSYIAQESGAVADSFVDELFGKLPLLAERPEIGVARETLATGLRLFPVRRYLIFYRWTPPFLEVIRVLHSSRDITLRDFETPGQPEN